MLKKKKKRKNSISILLGFLIALFFAVVFVTPIVLTITNSFMGASEIYSNYGVIFETTESGGKVYVSETVNLKFIPDVVSFSQYITVLLKSPDYLLKFWNSVMYVVPIVVFQLFVALLASFGFTRYSGRIKQVIFFGYVILMLMPYQVTLVPNYLVSDWLNILNTKWAIWLPGIFSPFAVYLLTKFMKRIPVSVMEAAQIDGCNDFRFFGQFVLPLSKAALASIGLMFFGSRMLEQQPVSDYADIMEKAFYNTVLGGMQLDGKRFYYVNPLECIPGISGVAVTHRHDLTTRPGWYACACCPPNVARLISSYGQFAYGESENTAYCHPIAAGEVTF